MFLKELPCAPIIIKAIYLIKKTVKKVIICNNYNFKISYYII